MKDAVNAIAHERLDFERLDVNVRRAGNDGIFQDARDELGGRCVRRAGFGGRHSRLARLQELAEIAAIEQMGPLNCRNGRQIGHHLQAADALQFADDSAISWFGHRHGQLVVHEIEPDYQVLLRVLLPNGAQRRQAHVAHFEIGEANFPCIRELCQEKRQR